MTADPTWSPQQEAALKAVADWLADPDGEQCFRMFGYAGAGKTTLAKAVAQNVQGAVQFAAFTGKASLVLRKKGCAGASTIHSMIYIPDGTETEETPKFVLNPNSSAADAELIVVDEVSMVGQDVGQDLLSFGTRVLVLGDPAQLPPPNGEGFFINAEPDIMLTEVHRQAADNPIIRMSMIVREGKPLHVARYGDSQVIRRCEISKDAMRDLVMSADQVLCGLNKTRHSFNARIRELHDRQGVKAPHHPVQGDRMVCLRNDRQLGLLNGGLWEAISVDAKSKTGVLKIQAKSLDDPSARTVRVKVPEQFFRGAEKELAWEQLKGLQQFTFGYALTVHKAQGSEFDNVVLFDESYAFREDRAKHAYTGITRASKRITVVV